MPHTNQVHAWLKEGEHTQLDFKQRVSDPLKIARTISSFANTKGGIILIGVTDFGEITGIDPEQEIFVLRKSGKDFCNPSIQLKFETLLSGKKKLLAVYIQPTKGYKHSVVDLNGNEKVYIRELDECVLQDNFLKENQRLENSKKPIMIYAQESKGLFQYLGKQHTITTAQYMDLVEVTYERAEESLEKLERSGVLIRYKNGSSHYYSLNTR